MKIKPLLKRFPFLSAFVISGTVSMVAFVVVLLISFEIINQYYPSHEVFPDGRIMRHQAFPQLFVSVIISAVVSITLFIVGYIKLSKRFEDHT